MPNLTLLEAIRQGIWEEMERDPSVFLLGEDIGAYGGAFKVTAGMLEKFGADRVIDTPISESAIVGAAVGAALMGMRPVVEMQFMDFIACGFDQIVNMAAKIHYRWGPAVPMVIRGPSGAGVHAHQSRSHRRADDGGFGNRRVNDALGAEFLEHPGGHLERAAIVADVFAEQEDGRVALHLLPDSLANGVQKSHYRHKCAFHCAIGWSGHRVIENPVLAIT